MFNHQTNGSMSRWSDFKDEFSISNLISYINGGPSENKYTIKLLWYTDTMSWNNKTVLKFNFLYTIEIMYFNMVLQKIKI